MNLREKGTGFAAPLVVGGKRGRGGKEVNLNNAL